VLATDERDGAARTGSDANAATSNLIIAKKERSKVAPERGAWYYKGR